MKKYLALTAAMFVFAGTSEAFVTGPYVEVTAGMSYINGLELQGTGAAAAATNTMFGFTQKRGGGGFLGGLNVGYGHMINSCYLFDVFFGTNYDTTKVLVGTNAAIAGTAVTNLSLHYKPQFSLSMGSRFGRMLGDKVAGLLGMSVDYGFGKAKGAWTGTAGAGTTGFPIDGASPYTGNINTWSVTPLATLRGAVNDKIHWTATVGYRINVKTTVPLEFRDVTSVKAKPNAVIANVGLVYNL